MKEEWIHAGYEMFAYKGKTGLKIEPLAKAVNKSKSSFYHHFADLDLFMDVLLQHHIQRSVALARKESAANNIHPELIRILIEHKTDIFFNRQLRIHSNNSSYQEVLSRSNQIVGEAFIQVWMKDVNPALTKNQLEAVFSLALDNFFLQINERDFHYDWLCGYFERLKQIVGTFA